MGNNGGIMDKIIWYFKQALPLKYELNWKTSRSEKMNTVWRMWLGRCFNIVETEGWK
jgi:hypothetical protein